MLAGTAANTDCFFGSSNCRSGMGLTTLSRAHSQQGNHQPSDRAGGNIGRGVEFLLRWAAGGGYLSICRALPKRAASQEEQLTRLRRVLQSLLLIMLRSYRKGLTVARHPGLMLGMEAATHDRILTANGMYSGSLSCEP